MVPTLPSKAKYSPAVGMRRLNWNKHHDRKITNDTLWRNLGQIETKYANEGLMHKLETTFTTKRSAIKSPIALVEASEEHAKKKSDLLILDAKAAQNLAIVLKQVKRPPPDLARMLLNASDQVPTDFISQMLKVVDFSQIDQFKELAPDDIDQLGNIETFCYEASKIKFLQNRLKYMQLQRNFDDEIHEISPQVLAIGDASKKLVASNSFKEFIALVLFCGNYMNSGSNKAQSYGFDIQFLSKLKDTKSADGSTTFINFLASTMGMNGTLDDFLMELAKVDSASRVSMSDVKGRISTLDKSVKDLQGFLKNGAIMNPTNVEDQFFERMSEFAEKASNQMARLETSKTQAEIGFSNVAKWLAFDEKRLPSDEFYGLLLKTRNEIEEAHKTNLKRAEAEQKLKQQKLHNAARDEKRSLQAEIARQAAAARQRGGLASTSQDTSGDEQEDDNYAAGLMKALAGSGGRQRKQGQTRSRATATRQKSGGRNQEARKELTQIYGRGGTH